MTLLTPAEVAATLRVSRSHVLALIRGGALGHVRIGPRLVRVTQEDLEAAR